jgi:hypothetical protein
MKHFLPIRQSLTTIIVLGSALLFSRSLAAAEPPSKHNFAASPANRDGSLFTAFVPVLRHPRCMNCHSTGDIPRQGDDGHPHAMKVRRRAEGHGVTAENAAPAIRTTTLQVQIFLLARPTGACPRPTSQ